MDDEGVTLIELFKVGVKHFKVVCLIIALCIIMGFGCNFLNRPKYTAKGSVIVVPETEGTNDITLVSTINSFIQRDFVLKETIETLELGISIENFFSIYDLKNEVDNNFINITCISFHAQNNINIVNSIIDKLVSYQRQTSLVKARILPTEYASYNLVTKNSIFIYLAGGLLLGLLISLFFVIYKVVYSPFIQTEEEIKRIIAKNNIEYVSLRNFTYFPLLEHIKKKKLILLNNASSEIINKLKEYYQSSVFIEAKDMNNFDIKKERKDNTSVFIICNNNYLTDEADLVINFLKIGKALKSDITNFYGDAKRVVVDF